MNRIRANSSRIGGTRRKRSEVDERINIPRLLLTITFGVIIFRCHFSPCDSRISRISSQRLCHTIFVDSVAGHFVVYHFVVGHLFVDTWSFSDISLSVTVLRSFCSFISFIISSFILTLYHIRLLFLIFIVYNISSSVIFQCSNFCFWRFPSYCCQIYILMLLYLNRFRLYL